MKPAWTTNYKARPHLWLISGRHLWPPRFLAKSMRCLSLGLLILLFAEAGCSKEFLPKIETLVQKSAAIYVVELKEGDYRISRILKITPETRSLFSVGQIAELLPGGKTHKERGYKTIIVFLERKTVNSKNAPSRIQHEAPLGANGKLAYYRITQEELVTLIEKYAQPEEALKTAGLVS